MAIAAVQHVRRMRGGAQSHLMRAADGLFYVVKFRNNPQHPRVLVNELLATRLGQKIGLPMAAAEVIDVGEWLIAHTPELNIQLAHGTIKCESGLQFGSRYVVSPMEGQVFDFLPEAMLENVRNLNTFAGMLALDKWTCNANGRQATFWRKCRERKYTVSFIDQGYCFNAGEWNFPDSPLRGVYVRNEVYAGVKSWDSFEPWLSRIEELKESEVWGVVEAVPPEWYEGDWNAMEQLVTKLLERKSRVRELIQGFRSSQRAPFPNWVN